MTATGAPRCFPRPRMAVPRSAPRLKNAANSSLQLASSLLSTFSATGIRARTAAGFSRRNSASASLSLSAGFPVGYIDNVILRSSLYQASGSAFCWRLLKGVGIVLGRSLVSLVNRGCRANH